jgi:hypothetical protein
MGGPDSVPLPTLVVSGQTVDVSVELTAPDALGQYQGYWQLQTPDGRILGIGPSAAGNLWVQIRVIGPAFETINPSASAPAASATATAPLTGEAPAPASPAAQPFATTAVVADFASDACAAQWQANDGALDCPGQDGDPRGTVSLLREANLEGGTRISMPSLVTVPSSSNDGYILGLYPQYQVEAGDHLQALTGCEQNAESCSVLFRVSYLDASGAAHDLWTLGEFYDGNYFDLDLDLSALAGQQVRFVLSVNDLGTSTGDRALWVAPRIVRYEASGPTPTTPPPTSTPTTPATPLATYTITPGPPIPEVPVATPMAPIPQFIESVLAFFRQLFGGP